MIAGTSKCATLEGKTRSYRMPCWSEVTFPMRFGSTSTSCGGGTTLRYDQTYAPDFAAGVLNGKRNFFWQTVCQEDLGGGNMRTSQVIGASLTPNLGAMAGTPDVADAIHATDVVTLAYPTDRTGGIGRVATTIGAYPVTTPMVTQFGLVPVGGGAVLPKVVTYVNPDGSNPTYGSTPNGGTAANRAIVIGKDQKLQVTFYRPQRTSFQQEYDATQPITKYHDLHGLNYGIQLEVGQLQFGCGPSTDDGRGNFPNGANQYTVDGSFTDTSLAEGGETGASVLTPIKDNTDVATGGLADSATEVPGSNTLTFTIDLAQCIAERLDFINAGNGLTDPASQLTVDDFVVASNSYHGSPTTAPLGDGSDLQGVSDKLGQVNHDEYTCIRINLAARGEAKTGGTDSAIQEMCIQFATDAFVGTSTNYLDGRTPPAP